MADGQNKDYEGIVLHIAEYPVVAYPVTPESNVITFQGFPEMSGIFASLDPVVEPVKDSFLNWTVKLA